MPLLVLAAVLGAAPAAQAEEVPPGPCSMVEDWAAAQLAPSEDDARLEAFDLARRLGRGALCSAPEDPRCMPASPSPATLSLTSGSLPALPAVPLPAPRAAGEPERPTTPPDTRGLGPANGHGLGVDRPPRR